MIDSLRPDHLGCYGSIRSTSPAIDSLAAKGVRFTEARATSSWTSPSVASILTGLYPSSHGVVGVKARLPEDAVSLAEVLQGQGYLTKAVVSHTLLSVSRGFGQGFDSHENVVRLLKPNFLSTPGVTDRGIGFLEEVAERKEPFFLFAHYFDPHYNYLRHPEIGFAADSVGRLNGTEDVEELMEIAADFLPEEFQFLADLYDEEIRYTDAGIGRLLSTLSRLGLEDETLIILTADHGEEFGTHGGLGHGRTLYEDVVRVPLIIVDPRMERGPHVRRTPVSLVSVTPTILDLVGVAHDAMSFQGESIVPLISTAARPEEPPIVFTEVDNEFFGTDMTALIVGSAQIIRDERSQVVELFDLLKDPDQLRDLSSDQPDVVASLLPLLDRKIQIARSVNVSDESISISKEETELLRSLGYIN